MKKALLFIFSAFSLFTNAQGIAGIINAYTNVTNIAGANITVGATAGFAVGDQVMIIQMKGATISGVNNATFGNITALNSAGMYEFADITAIAGNIITLNNAPVNPYNTANGRVQLVTVPKYCLPVVTNTLTCAAWNGTVGGVLAFEAGTLTLNSDINVTGLGFRGGNFITGGFCCSNGNFAGNSGGEKGESISEYIVGMMRMKGHQANGGGGSNCGNSGGGGGGNAGPGGLGGHQYNGCGAFDERGLGGLGLAPAANRMFLGGGGGGGFRDNNQVTAPGSPGGGIVYIRANAIVCNNRVIAANGASVVIISNGEGAGGGGAGGTIVISCNNYAGNLNVVANGGTGGSNFNTIFSNMCHGPGGGGGGGLFAFSTPGIPPGVTYDSFGGAAGTVNNPVSTCFNTTFGAQPGQVGTTLPNIPAPLVSVNLPTITVAGNNTVCAGALTTLTASGATSYTWEPVAILTPTAALNPLATTIYTIIGASGACTAQTTETVYILPSPTLSINGGTLLCAGQSTTLFATGAVSYTWNSTINSFSVSANPVSSTVFTLEGVDAQDCITSTLVNIQVNPNPTVFIAPFTAVICEGSGIGLNAIGANSYTWQPAPTLNNAFIANVVASPVTTTDYTVIGAVDGCTAQAVRQVSVIPQPNLQVTVTNTALCSGGVTQLNAIGAQSYTWYPTLGLSNPNSGFTQASPPVSMTYSVYASNGMCGASQLVSIMVVPNPVLNLKANPTKICLGDKANIFASGANQYFWSPTTDYFTLINNNLALVNPTVNTNYTVTGINSAGSVSCAMTQEIFIEVVQPVLPSVSGSVSVCKGESVRINVGAPSGVLWVPSDGLDNPNSPNPVAKPSITTVYTVHASAGGFCKTTSTVLVQVNPLPAVNAGEDKIFDYNEPMFLFATGTGSITWISGDGIACPDCPQTQISPMNSGCYVAQALNSSGCRVTDEACIVVNKQHSVFVPNSFTPNEDGINDKFMVFGNGIIALEMYVFDRWGEQLFYTNDRLNGWDGTFKGGECKQDTYPYKITYQTLDGKKHTKTGHVTLLK